MEDIKGVDELTPVPIKMSISILKPMSNLQENVAFIVCVVKQNNR